MTLNRQAFTRVANLVSKKWKQKINTNVNERIIKLKVLKDRGDMIAIGVYAQEDSNTKKKEILSYNLQSFVSSLKHNHYLVIARDHTTRIGKLPVPNIMGPHGEQTLNSNAKIFINFATFNDLFINALN